MSAATLRSLSHGAGPWQARPDGGEDRRGAVRDGGGATAEPLAQPTLCAPFRLTAERRGEQVALRTADASLEITWAQYIERVGRIAAGLAALGLEHGDTLALLLTNRPEFHLVDAAAMHLGAVPFSVYNTSTADQIAYVVGNAGSRVIVTERAMLDRVLGVRDAGGAAVEHVVVVESQGGGTVDGVLDLDALEAAGEDGFDLEARWRAVGPDDLLTLIYTSGTTGPPKGVEITHANMLAEWNGCRSVFPDAAGGRAVSFLPAAHIADRWSSHYGGMVHGLTLTCVRDPREVMAVVAKVRPTPVFGAVPRVWEKVKAALEAAVEADPDEARRAAVRAAIETGLRRVRLEQAGEEVGAGLAEAVAAAERSVFAGLRERLGLDAARFFVSGAAPIPVEVLEFFAAIGIPICELWGDVRDLVRGEVQPAGADPPGHRRAAAARRGAASGRRRRALGPRPDRHARLPRRSRAHGAGRRRGRMAAHGRHRCPGRGGLPEHRRPQEGADHQRGRQEHVAGEHRRNGSPAASS